jgi:hypothetical protein
MILRGTMFRKVRLPYSNALITVQDLPALKAPAGSARRHRTPKRHGDTIAVWQTALLSATPVQRRVKFAPEVSSIVAAHRRGPCQVGRQRLDEPCWAAIGFRVGLEMSGA